VFIAAVKFLLSRCPAATGAIQIDTRADWGGGICKVSGRAGSRATTYVQSLMNTDYCIQNRYWRIHRQHDDRINLLLCFNTYKVSKNVFYIGQEVSPGSG
jgi:hypothetical protein